ncbi:MAG: spermidine synthase, partial [Polyangiaceae bacterium]
MRLRATIIIAAMTGFIALSYEILWYRAFAFVSWGAAPVFGLLLFFYLFGLALGSLQSKRLCRDSSVEGQGRRLRDLAILITVADLVGFLVIPALGRFAVHDWRFSFLLVSLSAGTMGCVLPVVSHYGIEPDDRAGVNLSYVYLANIIGSASGSYLTGFVLMDLWSTRQISIFLALAGLLVVVPLLVASRMPRPRLLASIGAVVALGAFAVGVPPSLFDQLYERLLYKNTFTEVTHFKQVVENRHGVIAVNNYAQVYGGGAYDGAFNVSIVDDKNVVERAFAVGALHPHPHDVLMIGLSSGSWAQIVSHLPEVEHLTIVEINPGYLQLIEQYPAVASLLKNPKVSIVIDDGRRWLIRHPDQKFDFIVMNTTWHWRAHITNLLSQEFLGLARAHLNPGGIHYFNTTSSPDAQRTAALFFPYAMRVINFIAVSDSPFAFDVGRWEKILTTMSIDDVPVLDFKNAHQRDVFTHLMDFAKSETEPFDSGGLETRANVLTRTVGATEISDDNMACEWKDPLHFPGAP